MSGDDAVGLVPGLCRGKDIDNSVCAGHDVLFIVSGLDFYVGWAYLVRELGPSEDLYTFFC
jgi:hypothetical protein